MTYKSNINSESRSIHLSAVGDNNEAGLSAETPVATWAHALSIINALLPPPGITPNNTSIISQGSGNYLEGDLVFPTGCLVSAPTAFITSPTGDGIIPGIGAALVIGAVIVLASGKSAIVLEDKNLIGVRALAARCFGDDSQIFKLTGTTDQVYLTIDQLVVAGDRSIGYLNGCDNDSPVTIRLAEIILDSDDACGIRHDHASLNLMRTVAQVGSIALPNASSPTGTFGIDIIKGHCDASITSIRAETAIHVGNGAMLDIICSSVTGDIVVDAGGTLNCLITEHQGTVTNNGTIHGNIAGQLYEPHKPPNLTTTERDALTPTASMFIYNTTIDKLEYYDGTEWRTLDPITAKFDSCFVGNTSAQGTAVNVWAVPNDTYEVKHNVGFSVSGQRITYTDLGSRQLLLTATLTANLAGGANQNIGFRVLTNSGVLTPVASNLVSISQNGTITITMFVDLDQNDWIQLEVTNFTSNNDFTVSDLMITLIEISRAA